jgi:hypothetical protein
VNQPGDLLLRVRAAAGETASYPVEAELGDGSRFGDGQLILDLTGLRDSEMAADEGAYGRLLFEELFAGSIRTAYDQVVPMPDAEGTLRVRLVVDADARGLETIRWERLFRERRGTSVPLAASGDTPFSRYRALPSPDPLPVATLPIRILLAVSNPTNLPGGLQAIDVEGEIRTFRDAILKAAATDDVEVTILAGRTGVGPAFRAELERDGFVVVEGPTTLATLVRLLSRNHVIHIVGHGGFRAPDADGERQSAIHLEAEDGSWAAATADELVAAFAAADAIPALIYLSACETGRSRDDATHPFVALAPRLVDAGAAAVVAMQDAIKVDAARALTSAFYARLLDHGVIDLALNEARAVLVAGDGLDWSIPVLVTRLRHGRLFVAHDMAAQVVSGDIAVAPGPVHGAVADRVQGVEPPRRRTTPVLLRPRDFQDLRGRDTEVGRAIDALVGGGFIEFHGTPGVGKSVVLRNVANRAEIAAGDGVLYLARGSEPLHDLLQFLFDALYEADASLRPTDADLERLLVDCAPVIVLDDADIGRDDLERLLALVPKGRFLLAAVERNLWGEGTAVSLPGLAPGAALAVFERGLGRPLSEAERPRAEALCAALGGHPLHILQAAAAASAGTWPPAAAVPRPDVASLPELERRVLAVVVAAGAPLHVDRIAAVIGTDGVAEAAARLEDAGLLKSASPRYALAEPLDDAVVATLDLPRWRQRLLGHLVIWVEQNRNSPDVVIRDLDPILAVISGPAAEAEPALGLRLARGAEGALILAKRFERWAGLLRVEEGLAQASRDSSALGWVRHQEGTRALALKDDKLARTALREALTIREELHDDAGAAVTRHNLALIEPVPPGGKARDGGRGRGTGRIPFATLGFAIGLAALVGAGALAWWLLVGRPREVTPQLPAIAIAPATIDFGSLEVGQRAERTISLANASDVELAIAGLAIEPAVEDLSIQGGCGGVIAARQSCVLTIVFAPTAEGDRSASLEVDDNTLDTRHVVPILATGIAPVAGPGISIDPQAIDFGAVGLGETRSVQVTIASTGGSAVEILEVRPPVGDAFGLGDSDCPGRVLPPGSTCSIEIVFRPIDRIPYADGILISDTTEQSPHAVSLSGSGLIGRAELVAALDVIGQWVQRGDGTVGLPVVVSVRNDGDVSASTFYIGGEARVEGTEADVFLIGLVADPVDGLEQVDGYRVATTVDLMPGESIKFTGQLVFGEFFADRPARVGVRADTCAGEEIFDVVRATECRVPEIDDTNNLSNELEVVVPAPQSTNPPIGRLPGTPRLV